jgi:hypothetical protein
MHLDNAQTIINFMAAMKTEINYTVNYGRGLIGVICRLSKFHKNKPFKDMTREDVIAFLESVEWAYVNSVTVLDKVLIEYYLYGCIFMQEM